MSNFVHHQNHQNHQHSHQSNIYYQTMFIDPLINQTHLSEYTKLCREQYKKYLLSQVPIIPDTDYKTTSRNYEKQE